MKWLYKAFSKTMGRNFAFTPASVINDQMNEPRPLPVGMTEFTEWSDRIISGALLSADKDSQVFTLASMILTLGPTESHKPDAHFIHGLRKSAANQIAYAQQVAAQKRVKDKIALQEAESKLKTIGTGGALSLVKDEQEGA